VSCPKLLCCQKMHFGPSGVKINLHVCAMWKFLPLVVNALQLYLIFLICTLLVSWHNFSQPPFTVDFLDYVHFIIHVKLFVNTKDSMLTWHWLILSGCPSTLVGICSNALRFMSTKKIDSLFNMSPDLFVDLDKQFINLDGQFVDEPFRLPPKTLILFSMILTDSKVQSWCFVGVTDI